MIQVYDKLDPQVEREVGSFLATLPEANGACQEHDPRWLHVLRDALGHSPLMLVSRDAGGAVDGYLPLALVASRLFGRYLVSLPYLNRAGVAAKDGNIAAALIAVDTKRLRQLGGQVGERVVLELQRLLGTGGVHPIGDEPVVVAVRIAGPARWHGPWEAQRGHQARREQRTHPQGLLHRAPYVSWDVRD